LKAATRDFRVSPALAGDTFASFTSTGVDAEEAREIAGKVIDLVNEPFEVDGATARVGAHVGLVLAHPSGRRPAGAILGDAEAALHEARKVGGNAVKAFDPASFARQGHARTIERELWGALRNRQMRVVYQPQVRLSDFRLVGAEALVRWEHPVLGLVPPVEFIGIAEANGFIEELGRWVLEKACTDAAWWPSELAVAVNVSPLQLTRGDFIADARLALQRSRLRASRLHLEITESSFLAPTEGLFEMLADIRALGVSLALDDFGTGFSSLGYLTRLPLDKIKVDRTFVQRVGAERVSQSILKSVRTLTEELGVKLICEGIETKDELDFLRRIGCDEGQGFLFGRPQSETQFQSLARGTAVGS
jgi:EAL domain-containing protein (putative c-di-GMP-specific phosphodiesterase class I)